MNSKTWAKLYEFITRLKRAQLWSQHVKRIPSDSNELQTHSNDFLSVSHQLTTLITHKPALTQFLCLDIYIYIYKCTPKMVTTHTSVHETSQGK